MLIMVEVVVDVELIIEKVFDLYRKYGDRDYIGELVF